MITVVAKLGIMLLCLRAPTGVGPCSRALPQPSKRMKAPFPYGLAACCKHAVSSCAHSLPQIVVVPHLHAASQLQQTCSWLNTSSDTQRFAFPYGATATLTVPSAESAMTIAAAKLGIM